MQGSADGQRDVLDVESVAGHLLPAGSVFAFLAAHRLELFAPAMFEDLFPSRRGRPSLPPEVVASVIVLQALYGHTDREAVEALTFDLRWKAACGYAVDAKGFDPSALTYWRKRLASSQRPERIFEVVRDLITTTGAVAGKHRRALDSTVLDDAVARQDTVTQLIAAIRRVGREVPGALGLIEQTCTRLAALCGQDYTSTSKPPIAWDDQDARDVLVTALVNDALALLAAIAEHLDLAGIEATGGKPAEALALLALVAGQDVEPAEGSDGTDGRWRIARATAADRVISTVDPDARHAHKTQQRQQDGFKAHVVVEPDTGLITDTQLTKASGAENSDAAVGADLLARDTTITGLGAQPLGQQVEVLGDSAYASGAMLAALAAMGWLPVLKPWPLTTAVEGGFSIDDFTYDPTVTEAAAHGTLTCPGEVTRPVSSKGRVGFGIACRTCPLRQQCTTAQGGRTVLLGEHHQLQREHRARATDDGFQATYRQHRPMVERSIAWLTKGNRRVPYRGVVKNNAWLHHRVAAINLRRLLALGLTQTSGTWAIA